MHIFLVNILMSLSHIYTYFKIHIVVENTYWQTQSHLYIVKMKWDSILKHDHDKYHYILKVYRKFDKVQMMKHEMNIYFTFANDIYLKKYNDLLMLQSIYVIMTFLIVWKCKMTVSCSKILGSQTVKINVKYNKRIWDNNKFYWLLKIGNTWYNFKLSSNSLSQNATKTTR